MRIGKCTVYCFLKRPITSSQEHSTAITFTLLPPEARREYISPATHDSSTGCCVNASPLSLFPTVIPERLSRRGICQISLPCLRIWR